MIYVLLKAELPWQRKDAIIFLTCLCISGNQDLFWGNRLRELVPPFTASIMAKFQQFLWERFGNILERSFQGHKNSE